MLGINGEKIVYIKMKTHLKLVNPNLRRHKIKYKD